MTTRGDYSSLPGTVEELAAEAERALLEQGGSDHPDAHTYAAQAGAAMRTFFEPWFAADVDDGAVLGVDAVVEVVGVRRAMDELRRHERRIERRIEAEEAPETPQWPGGRPPHISRPGVTPW